MSDQQQKSRAEEFYEATISADSPITVNDVHAELKRLNENVEKSNTYLKYLVWFLVYLPLVAGAIYIIKWLGSFVE